MPSVSPKRPLLSSRAGADVAGYELWMGEWATSNFRLVYDGVDDKYTMSFTIDSRYSCRTRGVDNLGLQKRVDSRVVGWQLLLPKDHLSRAPNTGILILSVHEDTPRIKHPRVSSSANTVLMHRRVSLSSSVKRFKHHDCWPLAIGGR